MGLDDRQSLPRFDRSVSVRSVVQSVVVDLSDATFSMR